MGMYGPYTTSAATGGAGVATGQVITPTVVSGLINQIYVQYNDACPATTDCGIKTKAQSGVLPNIPIVTLTNANTDGCFHPRKQAVDTAGAAIVGLYEPFCVHDYIQVDLAQVNDGDSVTIWIYTV